jgi:hypothetical protein
MCAGACLVFLSLFRGSKFRAWEFSAGLDSWDDAPAPAWLGKRLVEVLLRRELSPQHARRRASRSLLIPAGRDV